MSFVVLTIPDAPAEWSKWLEERLTSPDFGQLIDELVAISEVDKKRGSHGIEPFVLSLQQVELILSDGMKALTLEQLRQLLASPKELVKLQESILRSESPYWSRLTNKAPFRVPPRVAPKRQSRPHHRGIVVAALLLLVGFAVLLRFRGQPAEFAVFDRTAIESQRYRNGREFFSELAERAARRRFTKSEQQSLLVRLTNFREECIWLQSHAPSVVFGKDLEWFDTKCKKWVSDLDKILIDAKTVGATSTTTLDQANDVLKRMAIVLKAGPS